MYSERPDRIDGHWLLLFVRRMTDDFSTFRRMRRVAAPIDPLELFASLEITDSAVENLWLSQGDALREWHAHRTERDVVISMNTGGGKTLVGLLCAHSLVNELRQPIVYVCSTRQLVTQTAEAAAKYGISVTTYLNSFSDENWAARRTALVTTYQAIFHGLSRFRNNGLAGIVFDDAHTAEQILRDQYTLELRRHDHMQAVTELHALFRGYFAEIDQLPGYDELCSSDDPTQFKLIPPFIVRENQARFEAILVEAGLSRCDHESPCKFAWGYLSDSPSYCAVFATGNGVVLTPPMFPSLANPLLQELQRRVYLSASLDISDSFIRTFGKRPDHVIRPKTDAGDCERLVLFSESFRARTDLEDDRAVAEALIRERKALISVPSYWKAERWSAIATPPDRLHVTENINEFKATTGADKLILVARYDGVDFPGEACRLMVIDGLPKGVSILERFFWEKLGIKKGLVTQVASRLLQWFGRISRGKRDHGVFILADGELRDWIAQNISLLPPFLQNQLWLGLDLSNKISTIDSAQGLINQCLNRTDPWLGIYREALEDPMFDPAWLDLEALSRVAEVEVRLGSAYWTREWQHVGAELSRNIADEIYALAPRNLAWFLYWAAYAHEIAKEPAAADEMYKRANGIAKNILLRPRRDKDDPIDDPGTVQATRLREVLSPKLLRQLDLAVADLDVRVSETVEGHHAKVEAAICVVGEALGLHAWRPDKKTGGSGPDVAWSLPGCRTLGLEAKTEKYLNPSSTYTKDDLSQLDDHRRWARREDIDDCEICFVGPIRTASPQSNPDENTFVITLEDIYGLALALRPVLADILANSLPLTMSVAAYEAFSQKGLLYPQILERLHRVRIVK